MGVPKFFRYMSERYPTLSQLVHEFEIPEFDNLYLDMNGIIHPCSHPNDFDPHFRITEKSIFEAIFHYIEFLFKTIKPQKLFFLAVDGVAPRAKMNQQRGRRFRSAKEAEVLENEAKRKGDTLPTEKRFDSNCITPGTVFMSNLHKQLEYFITMKISSDPTWQKCQIILSGHDTPGEGEHKIMDYIRYLKSQPNYDSNTRHCLYGLDADLIMLGMCTHDPNFCLLREEIKFSKKKTSRILTPEETNFYLLHLSLLRDYLDLEFKELKQSLPFPYNLESIIDDWVLMGFLVGNDFIPHLPDLHINSGAFPDLFKAYKEVLPSLDGYLNEKGQLNLKRFQIYLTRIAKADFERFEEKYADLAYLEQKLTQKPFDIRNEDKKKSSALQQLIAETEEMFPTDESDSDLEEQDRRIMMEEFDQHKSDYYRNKLEYRDVTEDVLRSQAEGYIRALQWILHYYYHGCRSWSWFYPHHYSPFVSDVAKFKDPNMEFDIGKPFLPFHQLLAVLPPASKELLPSALQQLMIDEESPIKDFYPADFSTDLNGKLHEWEAIVLIPFIEEQRLLDAMEPKLGGLSDDEARRNTHGPMKVFSYTKANLGLFPSETFSNIVENHAAVRTIWPHEIAVDPSKLNQAPGTFYNKDLYIPGFSTLRFIPHTGQLKKGAVRVFDRPSSSENVLVTISKKAETDVKAVTEKLLGRLVYVRWPHMLQAKVISISHENATYRLDGTGKIVEKRVAGRESEQWKNVAQTIQSELRLTRGIIIDDVAITVNVICSEGSRVSVADDGVQVENLWRKIEEAYALQTIVTDLKILPSTRFVPKTVNDAYPVGSKVVVLAQPNFGAVGEVVEVPASGRDGVKVSVTSTTDPHINVQKLLALSKSENYMPAGAACRRISLNPSVFNRITGTCFLKCGERRINIGLNLKYNKTNQEVPGYTKKDNGAWLYSEKTVQLVSAYWERFPEIFECLNGASSADFSLQDVYIAEESKGKDKEILKWIGEQAHVSVTPVTCGSIFLGSAAVNQLEFIVDSFQPKILKNVLKIKPAHLHKSDLIVGNIAPISCSHELLDRVVCCRYSHIVPYGLKGYIIGIYEVAEGQIPTFYVLFDQPFQGGSTTLGASKPRVCIQSASCFANISAGCRSNGSINLQNIIRNPVVVLSPERSRPIPPLMTTPSAFASVNQNQGNYVVKPLAANGHSIRPSSETKFSNMWREMQKQQQQPAEALMKALNINAWREKSQLPSPNPCSTLMSHFERSPLGVPKYEFQQKGNMYTAQVTLPGGRSFPGVPSPSKAGAGENAALQALAGLRLNFNNQTRGTDSLRPEYKSPLGPPSQGPLNTPWQPPIRQQSYVRPSGRKFPPQTPFSSGPPMPPSNWRQGKQETPARVSQSHSAASASNHLNFVPLQAIRRKPIDQKPKPKPERKPEDLQSQSLSPPKESIKEPPTVRQPPPSQEFVKDKPIRKKRQIAARFDNKS